VNAYCVPLGRRRVYFAHLAGLRSTRFTGCLTVCVLVGITLPAALVYVPWYPFCWVLRLHFASRFAGYGRILQHTARFLVGLRTRLYLLPLDGTLTVWFAHATVYLVCAPHLLPLFSLDTRFRCDCSGLCRLHSLHCTFGSGLCTAVRDCYRTVCCARLNAHAAHCCLLDVCRTVYAYPVPGSTVTPPPLPQFYSYSSAPHVHRFTPPYVCITTRLYTRLTPTFPPHPTVHHTHTRSHTTFYTLLRTTTHTVTHTRTLRHTRLVWFHVTHVYGYGCPTFVVVTFALLRSPPTILPFDAAFTLVWFRTFYICTYFAWFAVLVWFLVYARFAAHAHTWFSGLVARVTHTAPRFTPCRFTHGCRLAAYALAHGSARCTAVYYAACRFRSPPPPRGLLYCRFTRTPRFPVTHPLPHLPTLPHRFVYIYPCWLPHGYGSHTRLVRLGSGFWFYALRFGFLDALDGCYVYRTHHTPPTRLTLRGSPLPPFYWRLRTQRCLRVVVHGSLRVYRRGLLHRHAARTLPHTARFHAHACGLRFNVLPTGSTFLPSTVCGRIPATARPSPVVHLPAVCVRFCGLPWTLRFCAHSRTQHCGFTRTAFAHACALHCNTPFYRLVPGSCVRTLRLPCSSICALPVIHRFYG